MTPLPRALRSSTGSILRLTLAGLAVALAALGCGSEHRQPAQPESSSRSVLNPGSVSLAQAVTIQSRYGDALLDLQGVVGEGVGLGDDGQPVIKAYVTTSGLRLPSEIRGVRVEPEVTGAFRPLSLTGEYRPLAIGVSAGNVNECLPGTIGCVLSRNNQRFLLSCNHVFARQNQAAIGEAIVQPSRPDGSTDCSPSPEDAVATLADFQPLDFSGGTNFFDAAIARTTVMPSQITCATPPGFYGSPGATPVDGSPRLAIMKVGRTTELTRGSIKAINVKIKVTYPLGVAKFEGVMLTSADFGLFGDSGSLVVTDDGARAPVGLLFGGDAQGRGLVCPIGPILNRFAATICGP